MKYQVNQAHCIGEACGGPEAKRWSMELNKRLLASGAAY